jgi:hypothetical protein
VFSVTAMLDDTVPQGAITFPWYFRDVASHEASERLTEAVYSLGNPCLRSIKIEKVARGETLGCSMVNSRRESRASSPG